MESIRVCIGKPYSRGPLAHGAPRRVYRHAFVAHASNGSDVNVDIAVGPRNSRFVYATLDIRAPIEVIWDSLTDYDHLDEFVPSLIENKCLERKPTGAVLSQVGQQNIALGVKFCASAVLEIGEHIQGLQKELCWIDRGLDDWNEELWFPSPKAMDGPTPRDITFELIRGDFQAFKGLWRMQNNWDNEQIARLSYSLFIRPQRWLPVGLIQGRISSEAKNNLTAVKHYSEKNASIPL